VAYTATVTAGSTGSANNDTVSFSLVGSPAAACGTINPTSGSTGATNTPVTALYQASLTPGFCTVTATESATGATSTSLIDQTANPAPITYSVAVSAAPSSIPADGTSTSTISATVTTTNPVPGTPVAGDTVMFTVAGAHAGTINTVFATTNASGVATTTYKSSTTPGTPAATITAKEAAAGQSGTTTVNQSAAANVIAFTATPTAVHPSGNSVLQVTDTNAGVPVSGALITIVPIAGTCGTYTPLGGFTLANGTFTSTYTAPALASPPAGSFCTLQAGDGTASATVVINNLAT
jgi:adhesin/invasin